MRYLEKCDFKNPDSYKDIDGIPESFTRIIDNDILVDYTYQSKIGHPVFTDEENMKFLSYGYTPLQMAVYYDNSKLSKLLLDNTLYKASDTLKNGDNIIHMMVSQKFGDSFILQKLLQRLEEEVGSKEEVTSKQLANLYFHSKP